MSYRDIALNFACAGEQLFGVLSLPSQPDTKAVILIVGGPQYRVGSHRQFVQLARALAQAGYSVLRFDYRGMGDSSGPMRDFDNIAPDIAAATDALQAHCPQIEEIVLWGLCDAASAACMYAPSDKRVAGLVLLNPWVRDGNTYARTQIKHYYGARLLQRVFWQKLLRGEVRLLQSARESVATLLKSLSKSTAPTPQAPFQTRMLQGLRDFPGPVLLFISGRDLTAQEFTTLAGDTPEWAILLNQPRIERIEMRAADHTFSNTAWKTEVENFCVNWLNRRRVAIETKGRAKSNG